MEYRAFACVWDAVEPDPVKRTDLRLRADLLIAMHNYLDNTKLDRFKLARQLGINATRLKHLRGGNINLFQLGDLVALCVRAGLKVDIEAVADGALPHSERKGHIDYTKTIRPLP